MAAITNTGITGQLPQFPQAPAFPDTVALLLIPIFERVRVKLFDGGVGRLPVVLVRRFINEDKGIALQGIDQATYACVEFT